MKYYEAIFTLNCAPEVMQDARDLLSALAGEAGFETFEETADGLKGYIQQSLFSQQTLDEYIAMFPFGSDTVAYSINEAEDRDWNEQWEQEGFEPIIIGSETAPDIIIHDGRHLPPTTTNEPTVVEIDAKLSFGTGTHQTTRMICSLLANMSLRRKRVLDCGTGTGILSIVALKLGAREAVGYDIDEWSVDNARHNAVINQVDNRFTPLLGDASILMHKDGQLDMDGQFGVDGLFDVVMANINRNILLQDMSAFCNRMAPGASLLLSGFYTADIPLLTTRASELGLVMTQQKTDGDWACICLNHEL